MPRELKLIPSKWSADDAFAYISDFSNAAQWDPGVNQARRLDDGPVVVGSAFELEVKVGPRLKVMRYEVTRIADRSITFRSKLGSLCSEDTVSVEPSEGGCTVSYDASIKFGGVAAIANPVLSRSFHRIVERAASSLGAILMEEQ